jgi:tryptophan synthase alpha chain
VNGRIEQRFAALAAAGRTGLVPFFTAGDPSLESVVPLMHALVEGGADLIELGVPFSDPMADGPTIQHASERALARGMGLRGILAAVREFRTRDAVTPVVLMGYLNPLEIFGLQRFAEAAAEAGVDGVLLVDCPVEEAAVAEPLRAAGLRQIFLAAPTTEAARLAEVCDRAAGFLYYVSFAGITGAAKLALDEVRERVGAVKARARTPVAVGFGVRDAAQAAAIADFADAVVIGSALVETLAAAADVAEACAKARGFLAPIRVALDSRGNAGAA